MARNVVVIGTQWGDEGKGKVVDWLTDHAQGVVRFQGGITQAIRWSSGARKRFCISSRQACCVVASNATSAMGWFFPRLP